MMKARLLRHTLVSLVIAASAGAALAKDITLLNVSYDPTRELYQRLQHGLRRSTGRRRPATT